MDDREGEEEIAVKQPHQDPVTGDELPQLEYYTRQVQVSVRTPWFILIFNAITVLAMLTGHGDVWNYFASWLAIIIEWLVGTYMFGQTARDAVVSRETRANSRRIEKIEEQNAALLAEVRAISLRVEKLAQALLQDVVAIEEQLEVIPEREGAASEG